MNRRSLFRTAGFGLAAFRLPRVPLSAQGAGPGAVMTTLSSYMASAAGRALPPEVVEHAKHHIVDTFAAMISGSELPPGQAALRYAAG